MPGLETDKDNFKIAKISLQSMLHRKKSSYLEEKLKKKLKNYRKVFGLRSKVVNMSKISLN